MQDRRNVLRAQGCQIELKMSADITLSNTKHYKTGYFCIYFRNLRLCVALLLMDTSFSQNAPLITSIKRKALGTGLFEAFLEAAPQFVLQSFIILRTGKASMKLFNIIQKFHQYRRQSYKINLVLKKSKLVSNSV